jgi:hypothetical protein
MQDNLRLARPFLALLLLFAVGRWMMGVFAVPYTRGHHVFSLVTLTLMGTAFYGAFLRRWLGFGIMRAVAMGMILGFSAQLLIVILTAVSYALGIDSYFNHPTALNSEGPLAMGPAMGRRMGGLVVNTLFAGITGALGWFFGGALPDTPAPRPDVLAVKP